MWEELATQTGSGLKAEKKLRKVVEQRLVKGVVSEGGRERSQILRHVRSTHSTPMSSLCRQLWNPVSLLGQSSSRSSVPAHPKSSNMMWPNAMAVNRVDLSGVAPGGRETSHFQCEFHQ